MMDQDTNQTQQSDIPKIPETDPLTPQEQGKSSRKRLIIIVGLILIVVSALSVFLTVKNDQTNSDVTPVAASEVPAVVTIDITDKGFSPATVNIKAGTIVIWKGTTNTKSAIVASDPYPKDNGLVDLRSPQLGSGASYRYQFNNAGSFAYHDDLNPTVSGVIVVQ